MLLNGAFTVLVLVLFIRVSSGFVPPPTNVTVSCQNLKVTVSWDYDTQLPETDFRVTIKASTQTQSYEVYTTDHVYDLSDFIWTSKEHYLAFLFVNVTARQGGNQSENVTSKSFSFNNLKTVDVKCVLDFPPVELNVDETRASVMFQNPIKLYKLNKAGEPNGASILSLGVSSAASDFERSCKVEEDVCKVDVTFPEGVEKCIRLTGVLFLEKRLYQVGFRETDLICYPEPTDGDASLTLTVLAVILGSFFVAVILVVIFIICKVKAWTMKTPNPPTSLQVPLVDDSKVAPVEDKAEMSPVVVSSVGPEDFYSKSLRAGRDGGVTLEGSQQELEAVGLMSEGHATDEESADDSVKTECVSLSSQDEEEESQSPYDSPQFVMMDMGDGDMITGYTGK